MFAQINQIITVIDNAVWGMPLICLIMATGIFLTARLGLVQIRHLGKAFKFMFKDEEDGHGEVTSFGALCTALSATIGTGNIAGVATAIAVGGPGALFWMFWQHFSEWLQSIRKVFWQLNIVRSTRMDMFLEDLSTISKTVWERTGNGLQNCSHSLEQV